MRFTKMHGLGNDYLYIDCTSAPLPELAELAVSMSDRHFGAGADGLIAVAPGVQGDFTMVMYNADGSQGEMCGNGIRCLGKYVYDSGLTDRTELTIDTLAGPRRLQLHPGPNGIESVTVDMGEPFLLPEITLSAAGLEVHGVPVSMGNPHFIVFCPDPAGVDLLRLGPALERHPLFPNRTNVEFVQANANQLNLRVWERGSGETLACGTGACAALAAACTRGLCQDQVQARLPGGTLHLRWDQQSRHIYMTGPAVTVYNGDWPESPHSPSLHTKGDPLHG